MVVDDPGDDFVIDVQLQPPEEVAFADVETANEILFDARIAAAIEEMVLQPPETTDSFTVHARLRRIADGVASEVVSVDVAVDDIPPEERLSCVGCTCGATSPSGLVPVALALIALGAGNRARRRR